MTAGEPLASRARPCVQYEARCVQSDPCQPARLPPLGPLHTPLAPGLPVEGAFSRKRSFRKKLRK